MPASNRLWSILTDSRLTRGTAPWLVGLFVVANVYIAHTRERLVAQREANLLAPGAANRQQAASTPRYDWSVGENLNDFWKYIPDATTTPLVIVSGMSQMYAINDEQPGDTIIVERLDDKLRADGVRAFGLAAPNLDNEEALLYLVASLADPRTTPAVFVYGVCFDKFRNVDVRPRLLDFLRSRPDVQEQWRTVCRDRSAKYPHACEKMNGTIASLNASSEGDSQRDESFEAKLRRGVGRFLPVVEERTALNANFQLQIYFLRNWALRIKSTTKRPIIQSRHDLNRELIALMADVAESHGVRLVLYVIPLNPVADNPYVADEYAAFKAWVTDFAADRKIPFANLEGIVPHDNWGLLDGEPDFKHFRAAGHLRVANALDDHFGAIFRAAKPRAMKP